MTNEYRIRNLIDLEDLANLLLQYRTRDEWDCDMDDEWYICGETEIWITSDGEEFQDWMDALEHECEWLRVFEWHMMEHDKMLMQELYTHPCNMYNIGAMMPWMDYTPRTLTEIITDEKRFTK